jgi:hypothetical protein
MKRFTLFLQTISIDSRFESLGYSVRLLGGSDGGDGIKLTLDGEDISRPISIVLTLIAETAWIWVGIRETNWNSFRNHRCLGNYENKAYLRQYRPALCHH